MERHKLCAMRVAQWGGFFCLLMVMAAATLVALGVQAQVNGPAMTQVDSA